MHEEINIGRFIAIRRKYMRLTQEELAGKIGVSKSAVAKWETDGGIPDRDNLKRLTGVLNITLDDLYRIIDRNDANEKALNINITPDVIRILESYGYTVKRPGEKE